MLTSSQELRENPRLRCHCGSTPGIWKPDWKSFYDACDRDTLIEPVASLWGDFEITLSCYPEKIQIWSGRSESVRDKTEQWLEKHLFIPAGYFPFGLKMRPRGDNDFVHQLKEQWLDEALARGEKIEFVFDSDPDSIAMWRRRGIFVFDCNQKQDISGAERAYQG